MRVKLTQKETNYDRMRTKEVVGKTTHIPEVGEIFLMFSESLTPGGLFRTVNTSKIETCGWFPQERKFVFRTQNSVYEVEVLDDLTHEQVMEYSRWKKAN